MEGEVSDEGMRAECESGEVLEGGVTRRFWIAWRSGDISTRGAQEMQKDDGDGTTDLTKAGTSPGSRNVGETRGTLVEARTYETISTGSGAPISSTFSAIRVCRFATSM